jgi:hypothetical protein
MISENANRREGQACNQRVVLMKEKECPCGIFDEFVEWSLIKFACFNM